MSLSHSISPTPTFNAHAAPSPASSSHNMKFLSTMFRKKSASSQRKTPFGTIFSQQAADPSIPARTTPTRRPRAAAADMEPPPSYNDTVKTAPRSASPAAASVTSTMSDSPYSFLTQFDTIFLVDDSGSMAGRGWRETSAALSAITPICTAHDADGIDIFFLNHRNRRTNSGLAPGGYTNVNNTGSVHEIFSTVRPTGGTPTGTRLNQILKPYLAQLETSMRTSTPSAPKVKPINIIVITDGVPSDDVESVIVSAARKLDTLEAEPWQIGIQFFQVGEEPDAAEDLRELDDALGGQHNVRDIVDTVPWSGQAGSTLSADMIMKVTMGAVNRRLDRRRVSATGAAPTPRR